MAISSVKATLNGTTYNLALNEETGAYEAVLTTPNTSSHNQPNHYYPIEVIVTDSNGNSTIVNQADAEFGDQLRLYVKEEVKPTINVTFPANGSVMSNKKPTISWSCTDNDSGINQDSIILKIDSAIVPNSSLAISKNGSVYNCTYTPQNEISDGEHELLFSCKDNDGNTKEKAISIKIDTIPPSLTVSSPAENLYTNISPYTISGYTNDFGGGAVALTVNGNPATVRINGYFEAQVGLTFGDNVITVTTTDAVGLSTTIQRTLNYNNIPPEVSNFSIDPNPALVASQVKVRANVTDE